MNSRPYPKNAIKVAVIGGGTGSFTILNALKEYSHSIAAIVNMADDGGSTGVLRDELGTLPPGDVRQCLVALSDSPKIRDLFSYRFEEGTFAGHAFGNVFLSALEKMTGSFSDAVDTASDILRVNGVVIPATLDNVRLQMRWPNGETLNGEHRIDAKGFVDDPRKATISLVPTARAHPMAIAAIEQADLVIVAPGDLYTSLGPLLVINGFRAALQDTRATTVYVSNLVTKKGQTEGFSVADHADEIERLAGGEFLDYVFYNDKPATKKLAQRYEAQGAFLVTPDSQEIFATKHYAVRGGAYLGRATVKNKSDSLPVTRSLIRHDAAAIVKAIMELYTDAKI
jgi:uncharacterized cofD-like protein